MWRVRSEEASGPIGPGCAGDRLFSILPRRAGTGAGRNRYRRRADRAQLERRAGNDHRYRRDRRRHPRLRHRPAPRPGGRAGDRPRTQRPRSGGVERGGRDPLARRRGTARRTAPRPGPGFDAPLAALRRGARGGDRDRPLPSAPTARCASSSARPKRRPGAPTCRGSSPSASPPSGSTGRISAPSNPSSPRAPRAAFSSGAKRASIRNRCCARSPPRRPAPAPASSPARCGASRSSRVGSPASTTTRDASAPAPCCSPPAPGPASSRAAVCLRAPCARCAARWSSSKVVRRGRRFHPPGRSRRSPRAWSSRRRATWCRARTVACSAARRWKRPASRRS